MAVGQLEGCCSRSVFQAIKASVMMDTATGSASAWALALAVLQVVLSATGRHASGDSDWCTLASTMPVTVHNLKQHNLNLNLKPENARTPSLPLTRTASASESTLAVVEYKTSDSSAARPGAPRRNGDKDVSRSFKSNAGVAAGTQL